MKDPAILAWSLHKHLKPCVDRDPNQQGKQFSCAWTGTILNNYAVSITTMWWGPSKSYIPCAEVWGCCISPKRIWRNFIVLWLQKEKKAVRQKAGMWQEHETHVYNNYLMKLIVQFCNHYEQNSVLPVRITDFQIEETQRRNGSHKQHKNCYSNVGHSSTHSY